MSDYLSKRGAPSLSGTNRYLRRIQTRTAAYQNDNAHSDVAVPIYQPREYPPCPWTMIVDFELDDIYAQRDLWRRHGFPWATPSIRAVPAAEAYRRLAHNDAARCEALGTAG